MDTGGLLELEWQCPSCTLLNKAVSFKCRVCGTPKGTSTRQAKYHSAAIEKQYVAESLTKLQTPKHISKQTLPVTATTSSSCAIQLPSYSGVPDNNGIRRRRSKSKGDKNETRYPTLSNIDRRTGRSYSVTVDTVTVVITEYDLLYPASD